MIDKLIDSAQSLAAVLAQENAALRAVDLARATTLLAQKGHAIAAFTAANADAAATGLTAAERRRASVEIGERLRALADDNQRLLERAMLVQRRVMGLIAEAAPRPAAAPRYDARGAIEGARKREPVALSTRA